MENILWPYVLYVGNFYKELVTWNKWNAEQFVREENSILILVSAKRR
jgi:hypothetical protein